MSDLANSDLFIACSLIVLIASTISAILSILNLIKNPAKKLKDKHEEELKEKICQTLKEVLPDILKKHDLETRDKYLADRQRYLNEIKEAVLVDTKDELSQFKKIGLEHEPLVISARDILREKIIKIYVDNRDGKTLTVLEHERLEQFYKDYKALKGNSYIDKYYKRMVKWDIVDKDELDDEEVI